MSLQDQQLCFYALILYMDDYIANDTITFFRGKKGYSVKNRGTREKIVGGVTQAI